MADVKISALGAITSVAGEDLVAIVDDPSGTPASRKATIDQIKTYIDAMTASSTATLANKTFDVEGTGNSISNIDVADLKSGVLDTDISSVSGSDDTIPSAKAVKTYVDAQIATEDTLEELNDTTITSVGDNEILQYNSSSSVWENQTLAEAGISPVAGSTSITTLGTIATGVWNGTAIAQAYIAGDAIDGTKIADDSINSEHIVDGSVDSVHLATGIDATKIADGSVTSTEFQYINTLSSNAQTQLDGKSPTAGSSSVTTLGTITTGVWNGTAIAQAYIAGDAINGDKIADDSIDSEHYVDGSIDSAHLSTGLQIDDPTLTYSINAQTGTTYTPVLADAGKIITLNNASAITLTIPPNSSVAYPIGSSLTFINIGAGLTTFAQGSGVTIASSGGTPTAPSITAQHNSATCIKIATDTWQVIGAIE